MPPTDIHSNTNLNTRLNINENGKLSALLIDHDDSFTENIRRWLAPDYDIITVNHKDLHSDNISQPLHLIIISPGPKTPSDYVKTKNFILSLNDKQNVLGICLGFQILCELSGGSTAPYSPPKHGKVSALVSSVPKFNYLNVARYHSLFCEPPPTFDIIATADGLPMWGIHQTKKWMGIQFHPESFMTEKPDEIREHIKKWNLN